MPDHEAGSSVGLQVSLLSEESDYVRWDQLVTESLQANPFATIAWCKAVSEVLGFGFDLWIVAKGQEWLGGIPVFWRRRFGRPVCMMPPQGAYSSVIFAAAISRASYPSKVTSSQLEITANLARSISSHYSSATLKFLPSVSDVRAFQWEGWSASPVYTYVLDVSRELRCDHAVRKHVRKCRESGAVLSLDWQFEWFRGLSQDTVTRQALRSGIGMTYQDLERIACRMRDAGLAWMATALTPDGRPLASRIELGIRGTATLYDWVAGSSSELLSLGGNAWIMTQIAEEARRQSYSSWDLCGANYKSIAKFKSQFGGDLLHGWTLTGPASRTERLYWTTFNAAVSAKRWLTGQMQAGR